MKDLRDIDLTLDNLLSSKDYGNNSSNGFIILGDYDPIKKRLGMLYEKKYSSYLEDDDVYSENNRLGILSNLSRSHYGYYQNDKPYTICDCCGCNITILNSDTYLCEKCKKRLTNKVTTSILDNKPSRTPAFFNINSARVVIDNMAINIRDQLNSFIDF